MRKNLEQSTNSPLPQQETASKGYNYLSNKLSYLRTDHTTNNVKDRVLPLFPCENDVPELEELRNKYALRIQKGLAESIIKHKHARELFLWLEIKPLFISGVIFSDSGKYPYRKLAEFIGEGVSTIRKKIAILKRMKLLYFDREKNLHLASYDRLGELFKHHTKRKYKLLNNGETQYLVKQIAIYENLKRQEFRITEKICANELRNLMAERKLDPINSNDINNLYPMDCEKHLSVRFKIKFRKYVRNNLDTLKEKYKKIYDAQVLQLEFGFPAINPDATLSCRGIAKVLNRKSRSCGSYQTKKMIERKLMISVPFYCKINPSPAIWEADYGLRSDIFSYQYPTRLNRTGLTRLHFRRLPNTLETLVDAIFF